jgi:multidrug efflux pump subunit AcrA (membrane-fusion protein)
MRHFAKRRWGVLGVILAAGVAAVFLLRGFLNPRDSSEGSSQAAPLPAEAPTDRSAVTVTVAPVSLRPIQRTVHVVGTFLGYDELTVTAEVSGRVVELRHDVGDVVQPGEVLLRIDPTDYRLSLEEAWRALELDAARIGLPVPVIEDITPE